MKNGTEVRVPVAPRCDLCRVETPAQYDAKTIHGPWANLCQEHFDEIGVGLGLGKGQRLVVTDGA